MSGSIDSRAALAASITALSLLFSSAHGAETKSVTKVGQMTDKMESRWVLNALGQLERGSLPIRRGMVLNLRIDNGQDFALAPTPPNSKPDQSEKAKEPDETAIPDELKNDARFVFRFPDGTGMRWTRYVRHDPERRGMRFLDVIENTGATSRSLVLGYSQEMDVSDSDYFQGAATDQGVVLSRESPELPDKTAGVIFQFSPELSPAMPMFVFGKSNDAWVEERRVDSYQLKLERSGTLEPGQRAVFVHWIGCKLVKEKGKAEKAFERFISGGHLIEAGVPQSWQTDVVNFTPESFASPPEKTETTRLVMLEQLRKRLKLEPSTLDLLLLEPGSLIEGDFTASRITLTRGGSPKVIPTNDIAAFSGGAGKGRPHRLFLIDGSVLIGEARLESAKFKSKSVGEITLNVDSLDHLLIRPPLFKSSSTASKGLISASSGELLRLASLPASPLSIITAVGAFDVSWSEIAIISERPQTDPGFTISLKDGSRIAGLPQLDSSTLLGTGGTKLAAADSLRLFAAEEKDLETLLATEADETETKPTEGWCAMAHEVLWAGGLAEGELEIEAAGGVTRFRSSELVSARRLFGFTPASGAAITFDVELSTGLKLRGRFVSPSLRWQHDSRVRDLPWSLITELQVPKAAP